MVALGLIAGLVLLALGGELLVRGGGRLGLRLGLSPLVVGLTVVAAATSAPEAAVSIDAALSGAPGVAIGNVVGSNIANVLLVLVVPMAAGSQLVRADIPILIVFSVVTLVMAWDLTIDVTEGAILLGLLLGYLVVSLWWAARRPPPLVTQPQRPGGRWWVDVLLLAAGVGLLVVGARLLVGAATSIAEAMGVSDLVIGLTVVAVGTSLPELATSVVAAAKGEPELAVGNVVGSGIFNLGAVLGATAVVGSGIPVDESAVRFDMPVMIAVAVVLLPLAFTGYAVSRIEGAVLLGYFGVYTAYLLLDAGDHQVVSAFGDALLFVVLPLTAVGILLSTGGELRRRSRRRKAGRSP
ncbi:MAG TPA: calcium/sodium antiporter [Actinotalea sp.]|nr:calcium/sodium antiporter [Actinotalea sp.]